MMRPVMRRMIRTMTAMGIAPLFAACLPMAAAAQDLNDYPTIARADYIFGCLAVNGQTRDSMARCACSIDTIASILPYDDYVAGETVLSMRQMAGERAAIFRGTAPATEAVANLRRAQAEAEILCF
ncbi:hypothetical protein [Halodurantibacterium flavum]|uniref:Rap1a immunity protein domain-containing protein n=1 Tax=Halodurantibacterium flavum TaxID=1382802 RepID=A0ABW4SAI6_9RHOB